MFEEWFSTIEEFIADLKSNYISFYEMVHEMRNVFNHNNDKSLSLKEEKMFEEWFSTLGSFIDNRMNDVTDGYNSSKEYLEEQYTELKEKYSSFDDINNKITEAFFSSEKYLEEKVGEFKRTKCSCSKKGE